MLATAFVVGLLTGTLLCWLTLRLRAQVLSDAVNTLSEGVNNLSNETAVLLRNLEGLKKATAVLTSERDHWREWYTRQSAEHGNAQALLFRELELHVKQPSAHVKRILNEYKGVHPESANRGDAPQPGSPTLQERIKEATGDPA